MMDVKVLILFVMSKVSYPVNVQQIYELCYQDDCLSYFDVCTAIPEMVKSGHLKQVENDCYEITDKGKADGSLTEDSIAYTVKCRADNAVNRFSRSNRGLQRLVACPVHRGDGRRLCPKRREREQKHRPSRGLRE